MGVLAGIAVRESGRIGGSSHLSYRRDAEGSQRIAGEKEGESESLIEVFGIGTYGRWGMAKHWGEDWGEEYPHRDIIQAIIVAAIRVQRGLGPGLLEETYKVCLAHALRQSGHRVMREVRLDIEWEGLCVPNAYIMDLVVDDKVVVEAKTVARLVDANFAQLNTQLRFTGLEVGLLLNFRAWPLKEGGIKRVIHTRT
jgi:GxxExxY protein